MPRRVSSLFSLHQAVDVCINIFNIDNLIDTARSKQVPYRFQTRRFLPLLILATFFPRGLFYLARVSSAF